MTTAAPMQQAKAEVSRTDQSTSQTATKSQHAGASEVQFADLRSQTTTQRQLQNTANHSAQSCQLKSLQQMVQNMTRPTQLKAMSSMMKGQAIQRVGDEETLQAKMDGVTTQLEAEAGGAEAPKSNNTGLPDNLKSGIESLSGLSMDHVKVHYNSSQPAQLNAHAYAQGSEIHVAPGQEQHLPHEAWHVVQQAQGRVRPTMQMKAGVAVNDDVGLEAEADVMGAKALGLGVAQMRTSDRVGRFELASSPMTGGDVHNISQLSLGSAGNRLGTTYSQVQSVSGQYSPVSQRLAVTNSTPNFSVIQRARYVRALNGDDRVANEILSLKRVFLNETNRQHQVNTWVDGFAGMPTARFNGNERNYYSPVGYMLETEADEEVLANYRGDGNTNDIPVTTPKWVAAAQVLRQTVLQVEDYTTWTEGLEDDPWGPLPEMDADTGTEVRNSMINYYLKPYLDSPDEESEGRAQGKTDVRAAIKNCGIEALIEHYGTPEGETQTDRFIGRGVNPEGMDDALGNQDVRYIESILHARLAQVRCAWYNRSLGNYSEAAAQENWRQGEWLNNRIQAANAIRDAFNNEGLNIAVEEIGPAPVEQL